MEPMSNLTINGQSFNIVDTSAREDVKNITKFYVISGESLIESDGNFTLAQDGININSINCKLASTDISANTQELLYDLAKNNHQMKIYTVTAGGARVLGIYNVTAIGVTGNGKLLLQYGYGMSASVGTLHKLTYKSFGES